MPRASRAGCAALFLAGLFAATPAAPAQSATLVFIVRHAEKASAPASDPPLTAEGEARARALADLLRWADIGVVITTPYARARQTAGPLRELKTIPVEEITVGTDLDRHARAVADAVRKHAGSAVLVVGHSNTVTRIAAALGAPALPDLCDGDYDQLFVVELSGAPPGGRSSPPDNHPPRFVRARYGAPASDPGCGRMIPGGASGIPAATGALPPTSPFR
jgi:broad specificity phosphatase PhoE